MCKFGVFFFAFLAINLIDQTYSAPPARNVKSPELLVPKMEFNQENIPKEFQNRVLKNIHENSIDTNIKSEPVNTVFGEQGYIDPKTLESQDTKPTDIYVRNLGILGKTPNLLDLSAIISVDKPSSRIQSASQSREHKGKTLESIVEKLKLRLQKKNHDPNENVPKTNQEPDLTPLDLSISGQKSQISSKPIEIISYQRETLQSVVEKFKQRKQNRDLNGNAQSSSQLDNSEPPNKRAKVDNENVVNNERERSPEPESERSSTNEFPAFGGVRPYWTKLRAHDPTFREFPIEVFSFNTVEGMKRVVYLPRRVEEDYLAAGIQEMPIVSSNGMRFDWRFSDNHVRMEHMPEE